ncbi:retrovirus-related pol polyprotein from transposon RE1 [Tanacetum coccineum]
MNNEIEALEKNNTWELNTLPHGKIAIGSKWVYKIKHKADGNIERTLLAISINHEWIIKQVDVNNAFLHGDLHEEANRQWFEKLTTFLKSLGFRQSYVDTSLFTLQTDNTFLSLLVYVDDILIACNDRSLIDHLKTSLHTKFSIKDLGPLHYYLGIEFLRNKTGITLTQRKYALDLVTYVGLLDTKPSATPLNPNKKLTPDNDDLLTNPSLYIALVGKLLYLTITMPDLSFAAHALSQFLQQPISTHMKALLKVISCPFPRRSVTSYGVFLGSSLISWQSKKQIVVSRSSTEAEYKALADSTCEVTWIQCLLKEFKINVPTPIPMMCDNASSIALASNPVHHARSKHIEIDCHFIRDKVKAGQILPQYIFTKNQLTDILTKGLSRPLHYTCLTKLGMCNPYTLPTCEGDDKSPYRARDQDDFTG